jgi:hypothetical protein
MKRGVHTDDPGRWSACLGGRREGKSELRGQTEKTVIGCTIGADSRISSLHTLIARHLAVAFEL